VFSLWSVHGLYSLGSYGDSCSCEYSSELRTVRVWYRVPSSYQLVSDGKGCHKSWLQQWLQSWIRDLQRKRRDSVVVSCKSVYTVIVCNCVWSNKSSCQSNTRLI
jgi:hypothetical protein